VQDYPLDRALEITTAMLSTRDLDELLKKIVDAIMESYSFQACDAFLYDSDKDGFVLWETKGFDSGMTEEPKLHTTTNERFRKSLSEAERIGRFTYLYKAKEGDDPSNYFSLLNPEKASLPREHEDDWHELDVLYILFEDAEGNVIGFLEPDGPRNGKLPSETLVKNLEVFASLASIAVTNAEIMSQLDLNIKMYKALMESTATFQEPLGLKATLERIAESLNKLVPFDEISVYLVDWERNLLTPVYATGPYAEEVMTDIGPISGLAGDVARTGTLEIVDDSLDDDRVEDIPGIEEEEIRQAMMAIPLKSMAGEVEGVLELYREKSVKFTAAEAQITEPFATHASIAMENARLRDELRDNFESVQKAFEEMKILDKAKDSLVNTISHELRTPITTILGYLEMASAGLYGEISDKMRDKFRTMIDSVNRINRLVAKMLEMSRLEEQDVVLELEPVNLAMVTKEVVNELEGAIGAKGHKMTVLFGASLPVVRADRLRMHDVMENLLNNAVRYTPNGGEITVGADILSGRVHIWVRDTGIGIAEEDRKKVFDKFFLADAGLTREDGRVGIGLYVSRNIVRKHGGDMWFETKKGMGSTFHFTLPINGGRSR
jgi:signal transduction histidine kinase